MSRTSIFNGNFLLFGNGSGFFNLLIVALAFLLPVAAAAQDELPENVAPPPVRAISKGESEALEAKRDIKDRTKLAIELMDARLRKAETLTTENAYGAMLTELGSFHALMNNAIRFLNENDTGRGKVMDTFKRFEIALRGFTPRIETIRRELPVQYEFHVRSLLRSVRDTRAKAVEPLFSDTVLPDKNN